METGKEMGCNNLKSRLKDILNLKSSFPFSKISKMAKSSFEYVKDFEQDDKLLLNSWIVVRLDGKCFHKFCNDHNFQKPNDLRALKLMNYAAYNVTKDLHDIIIGFGQSDEYSFVLRKKTDLYKRRAAKLLTTINSKFSAYYVFYWNKFFGSMQLKYPPCFDGRVVLYPSNENLIDYLKWRQADVHINNLYNTTFWKLIQEGNLSPAEAEKRLCGTVSSDKHEILFKEFKTNYNKEPDIFKRGTLLLRKSIEFNTKTVNVIVDVHDDVLKENYWKEHGNVLVENNKSKIIYKGPITDILSEQLEKHSEISLD